jgi:hypothetical protein
VVSSWVGNGDALKVLDDGRDKESEWWECALEDVR